APPRERRPEPPRPARARRPSRPRAGAPSVSESITVLLPCGVQKREYLLEAVGSIRGQTSPRWHLLVGLDPSPPPGVDEWLAAVDDPRVRRLTADRPGFAPVLNALLRAATTPFVAILLSDD